MLRSSWPLLLAALAFTAACGPNKNDGNDAGHPVEDDAGHQVDAGLPSCDDQTKNGDETGVDCGGSCAKKCDVGAACTADADCSSTHCVNNACVACTEATQCPGSDTTCQTRTCDNNVCGVNNVAAGTAVTTQTAGDCHVDQCDGNGQLTSAVDDTDLPADDGQECTTEVCTQGVPSHAAKAVDTQCSQNGGSVCDAAGACVACNAAAQCPGSDTECHQRTCTAGVCGVSNTASGTPVATQTAGDCKQTQCDGNGGTTVAIANSDVPADDGNQCTSELCSAGVPSHPVKAVDTQCSQNGGSVCSATGACVACNSASQCTGSDNECQQRTCTNNSCGLSFTAAGTPVAAQTPGDCKQNACNGAGQIVAVNQDTDLPVDNAECTSDVCSNGVPSNPPLAANSPCSQNGGTFCSGAGACVQCNAASQCSGTDSECSFRTCLNNTCGTNNVNAGAPALTQTSGDCKENQCNGTGGVNTVNSDTDVPADDGNQCTSEACFLGNPVHPAKPQNTTCSQNGGTVCDSSSTCVQCNTASQCAGVDTECQTRTCSSNTCGTANSAAGYVTSAQTAGDCKENQCDGNGNIIQANSTSDVPADDGNQCTAEACSNGTVAHPAVAAGTPCNQGGGTACDGAGACVAAPAVASTTPADNSTAVASTPISITFTSAMNGATLTAQTTAGACSGSIQVSSNDFASCVAMASGAATMSAGNTVATVTPAPGLLINTVYKIRVTTAAQSTAGMPLAAQYTSATGFTTTSPNGCTGSLVISQVYGGGGNSGATYKNDFIELHNRGSTPISLSGLSLQYSGSGSTGTWNVQSFTTGTVQPGGYFLVQESAGTGTAPALPTPDATGSLQIGGAGGKVALVVGSTALSGACPASSTVIDRVGWGPANCAEGTSIGATTNAQSVIRGNACVDNNNNLTDFQVVTAAARNSGTSALICGACGALNESNVSAEADYCTTQFPLSLSVTTGTSTGLVFGQIYEAGVTEAGGAATNVVAQLGYGAAVSNPEYETWTWFNATFNVQSGNNDEYQASFTAPASGTYRYGYRFSLDNGQSWTYCDNNQGDTGAGSNTGLTFTLSDLGVMTVTP